MGLLLRRKWLFNYLKMSWFVKMERFTPETIALGQGQRERHLKDHRLWVEDLCKSGVRISSGYLVNQKRQPGGGGLMLFEAETYEKAEGLIKKDPMIKANLVDWELQEWIPVAGSLID